VKLNEIRETVQGNCTIGADGYGIVNKRINLKKGYRHQIYHIDMFNDMGVMWMSEYADGTPVGYQIYVSPYPIQINNEEWGTLNHLLNGSGPMAGDNTVLYKGLGFTKGSGYDQGVRIETEFPNDSLGAWPTFAWYSDHVYLSVVVFNEAGAVIPIKISAYIATQEKKANKVEHQMGVYAELLEAQCRLMTSTAVNIDPITNAGYTWPMWTMGGSRPELMLDGPAMMQYYGKSGYGEAEDMESQAEWRTRFTESSTMVGYDQAFGDDALELPQWINVFDVEGIFSGPIRPQFPPNKYHDNGNSMML